MPPAMPILVTGSMQNTAEASLEDAEDRDDDERGWMKEALHQIEQGDIGSWLDEKLLEKEPSDEIGRKATAGPSKQTQSHVKLSGRRQSSEAMTGTRKSSRVRAKRSRSSSVDLDDLDQVRASWGSGIN